MNIFFIKSRPQKNFKTDFVGVRCPKSKPKLTITRVLRWFRGLLPLNPKTKKGYKNSNQSNTKQPAQKKNDDKNKEISNGSHYTKFSQKIHWGSKSLEEFLKEVNGDLTAYKCLKCHDLKTGKQEEFLLLMACRPYSYRWTRSKHPSKWKSSLKESRILLERKKTDPDQQI